MVLPMGFTDFVKEVYPSPSDLKITRRNDEIWKNFCRCSLVGRNRVDAETNYVFDELGNTKLFNRNIVAQSGWVSRAEKQMNRKKKRVKNPSKKEKITAFTKIERGLLELDNTLKVADNVFNSLNVSPSLIKAIANDKAKTGDLLSRMVVGYIGLNRTNPHKIPNTGYTKAVLWLHSCGIGKDFAPDNNHTIRFLDECGLPGSKFREDYYVVMRYVNNVVKEINSKTKKEYSVHDVSYCIYLYMATKNLVRRKFKKYYDPNILLAFLSDQGFSIVDLEDYLYNIELVSELEELINDFLDRTFAP